MASTTELLANLRLEIQSLRTRIISLSQADAVATALGVYVVYGCKVTAGESEGDMLVTLDGNAPGDEAMHNPYAVENPQRGFEYPNIASILDGGPFHSVTMTAVVDDAPGEGLARYDIAYIYVGQAGAGFAIATGTPSEEVKEDFDLNGLDDSPYASSSNAFDPPLPLGACPVGRIYVEGGATGIPNSRIAVIRPVVPNVGFEQMTVLLNQAEEAMTTAVESAQQASEDAAQVAEDRIVAVAAKDAAEAAEAKAALAAESTAADRAAVDAEAGTFLGKAPTIQGAPPAFLPVIVAKVEGRSTQVFAQLRDGQFDVWKVHPDFQRKTLSGFLESVDATARTIPLVMFQTVNGRRVAAVWLDPDGALDTKRLSDRLLSAIQESVLAGRIERYSEPALPIPVISFTDTSGRKRVGVWFESDGAFCTSRLSTRLLSQIQRELITGRFAPANLPSGATLPLITDGRSLARWRSKISSIRAGVAGIKAKLAITGDSWAQLPMIPAAIQSMLHAEVPVTAPGWRQVISGTAIAGETFSMSGWTSTDGSNAGTDFTYGVGPDGNGIRSTSTTSTISLSNWVATSIKIFTFNFGGTWRYRIDGGDWVVVEDDNDEELKITSIAGLSDAAHTLEIDTTGNAGVVSIGGIYGTRATAGTEVLKVGNGGVAGSTLLPWVEYIPGPMAELVPDAVVVFLGTNDARIAESPVSVFVEALSALIAAYRQAVADIGIVVVAPAVNGKNVVRPLSLYRDAAYQLALEQGCEFVNLYDQFGTYAQSSSLGQWEDDDIHPNASGGTNIASILHRILF